MDYLADDIGYECTYRYNTHNLGFISVKFDADPSQIAYCVCSRVLIDDDEQEPRNRAKRKKRRARAPKKSAFEYDELDEEYYDPIINIDEIEECDSIKIIREDEISPAEDVQTKLENDTRKQDIDGNCAINVVSSSPAAIESTEAASSKKSCCGFIACLGNVVMYARKKFETIRQCCSSRDVESTSAIENANHKIASIEKLEEPPICLAPDYKYDPVHRAVIDMRFQMIASALTGKTLGVGYNKYEVEYLNRQHGLEEKMPRKKAKKPRFESTPTPNNNSLDVIPITTNKRKKNNNRNKHLPVEVRDNAILHKYWIRRYSIFSKYDQGIQMDEESWYSVTPEAIAAHIADVCTCETIIDGFCGAGGNTIQFAFKCERVIAIDINPQRIEMARNNARVYGVEDKIRFIVGDFFEIAPKLKADVVFLSPPWGGPDYLDKKVFPLEDIAPRGGREIYETAKQISNKVAYFLPRNINIFDIADLMEPKLRVEMEQQIYAGKLFANCVYFDRLALNADDLIKTTKFRYQNRVVPVY